MESAIATSQEWTTFRSTQLAEATESKAGQDLPTQRRDNDHKRPRRKPNPMRITRSTQPNPEQGLTIERSEPTSNPEG
jgi:hypothetical protein